MKKGEWVMYYTVPRFTVRFHEKQFFMRQRQPVGKPKDACSKCGGPLGERYGKQRYCRACHCAHMRLSRPKHSEMSEPQRKKANARSYLNVYIRKGYLVRGVCKICGDTNVEAHHHDYNKPLEVIWLCKLHHRECHQGKLGIIEFV